MMGHSHALSGAVGWLAAVPLLQNEQILGQFAVSLSPAQIAAGTVVCAGAALLPDMDHHDGSIANTFGIVTQFLCKIIGKVSGGHRQATHSILFAVLMGFGADLLATHAEPAWWVLLFLLIGLGLRGLEVKIGGNDNYTGILNAVGAAVLVYVLHGVDMTWAGYAVFLGCLMHVTGDCCTPRGCPVFWPAPWRIGVAIIPRTNGKVERYVITPLLTVGAVILIIRTAVGDEIVAWLDKQA